VLSDVLGLTTALTVMPAFAVLAAAAFLLAARSYEADKASAGEAALAPAGLRPAVA